jgi:pimeloyl-ACP methyl ester carboxylesterase
MIRKDMIWRKTPTGWLGDHEKPSELLVAVLPDQGVDAIALRDVAAAWSISMSRTAFVIFERLDAVETELAATLVQVGLCPNRLLLVGFGSGGQIGLSLALNSAQSCAGLLAYDVPPAWVPDATPIVHNMKIRLVGHRNGALGGGLGDIIRRLVVMGIDARATQLPEPGLTPSAIRIGAAYLADLSASALHRPAAYTHGVPAGATHPKRSES